MIVEMRTYMLKPGSVPEVESLMGRGLPERSELSPLGGLWHTTSGQLNTIIHMWPYSSVEERMTIRQAANKSPNWPPPLRDFLVEMDAKIVIPAAFSPALTPAKNGSIYEFCIDSFLPGGTAESAAAWSETMAWRSEVSSLVFCGTTEFGHLNQWIHVWAYRDAAHREEVGRMIESKGGRHRVGPLNKLLKQEIVLAEPAECSPLR